MVLIPLPVSGGEKLGDTTACLPSVKSYFEGQDGCIPVLISTAFVTGRSYNLAFVSLTIKWG